MTGPEALASRQFVLMATEDGDAWLLDPEEDKALCLVWHGVRQEVVIRDLPTRIEILWHGDFQLSGHFFAVQTGKLLCLLQQIVWQAHLFLAAGFFAALRGISTDFFDAL